MKSNAIVAAGLTKKFTFSVRDPERGWMRNLFAPQHKEITAVDHVSLTVEAGERVAFIGPNGAGKSTTIKMLTGILTPTAGKASVLGLDPVQDRQKLAYKIGTVFGQRSQLLPNLPIIDSFEFFGVMYDLPKGAIDKRVRELTALFGLDEFAGQPVRKLSLGQRMRGEVAAALIHKPKIILLDEPTIGLDVVAKKALRDLLLQINKEEKTTIFLTSHDVGDVETLCERTVIINHGKVIKDMATDELARTFVYEKYIDLIPESSFDSFPDLPEGITYAHKSRLKISVVVDVNIVAVQEALRRLLEIFKIEDIDVNNAELEAVIRHIYESAPPGQ